MTWLVAAQHVIDWLFVKVVAEVYVRLVAKTVEAERLVIKIVVIDNIDGVDKYRGIALS